MWQDNLALETGVIIISIYIGIDKVSIGYMAMGVIQCAILLCMAKIMKQNVMVYYTSLKDLKKDKTAKEPVKCMYASQVL